MTWAIFSDSADLIVECAQWAERHHLPVETELLPDPFRACMGHDGPAAWLTKAAVRGEELAALGRCGHRRALLLLGDAPSHLLLASDLCLLASQTIGGLLAALSVSEVSSPWNASVQSLPSSEQSRFVRAGLARGPRGAPRLRIDEEGILHLEDGSSRYPLGPPSDAIDGLLALRAAAHGAVPQMPTVAGLDRQRVLDVILGPPRALSDPASKSALAVYDVPLPEEVLCASASRAATEATRIGYPVRIALASPELRHRDHPDLVAHRVESASRARDVFRSLTTLAKSRASGARILGVMVSNVVEARTRLWLRCTSLAQGICEVHIGFADPHGRAAEDVTSFALPCRYEELEQRLSRLRGHTLLLGTHQTERRRRVEVLADVLLRVAAFVDDWRGEVDEVRIDELAVLVSDGCEIREACVVVGDAFHRSLMALEP